MSCDFPACGYVIYTESIMAMSNKPAAQKTEGTWIPQGAHTATTAGSLHQLPCVQHGRDGQRPALRGGAFTSSILTFAFTFINLIEGSFVKLPIPAQPIAFSPPFFPIRVT